MLWALPPNSAVKFSAAKSAGNLIGRPNCFSAILPFSVSSQSPELPCPPRLAAGPLASAPFSTPSLSELRCCLPTLQLRQQSLEPNPRRCVEQPSVRAKYRSINAFCLSLSSTPRLSATRRSGRRRGLRTSLCRPVGSLVVAKSGLAFTQSIVVL